MKTVFVSDDIACGGCTSTIEKALTTIAGVMSVVGDPALKSVTVEHDEGRVSINEIVAKLDELGFESRVVA